MNVFLLAAGEGVRFRPHTEKCPKPALPFCGAPLLHHSFYLAQCLNPTKIVINTFHLAKAIHEVGAKLSHWGPRIYFSDEQPQLLGSGGGIAKAYPFLKDEDDFVAMNSDEVILPDNPNVMKEFYQSAKASARLATLMVMQHPEAGKKFGAVWVDKNNTVVGFGKTKPKSESENDLTPYHFIGPMYFRKSIFSRLTTNPSNILHDTLTTAISKGESIGIFPINCHWFETGNLEDYLEATHSVLKLLYQQKNPFLLRLQSQLTPEMELLNSSDCLLYKHKTAHIESMDSLKGFVVLGAHVRVPKTIHLKNVVCNDGVLLKKDEIQNLLL